VALLALFVALGGTAVAAGVPPFAKRAGIADNAKKLQNKTAAQVASLVVGRIVVRPSAWSLPASGSGDFAASCQPGEKVVGGGYDHASGDVFAFDNRPAADGSGWKVFLESLSPTTGTSGNVYAVCLG
jgi:hypothetical protein